MRSHKILDYFLYYIIFFPLVMRFSWPVVPQEKKNHMIINFVFSQQHNLSLGYDIMLHTPPSVGFMGALFSMVNCLDDGHVQTHAATLRQRGHGSAKRKPKNKLNHNLIWIFTFLTVALGPILDFSPCAVLFSISDVTAGPLTGFALFQWTARQEKK